MPKMLQLTALIVLILALPACAASPAAAAPTELTVAGNIPGRTQTMSMAIYDAVQANNLPLANQLALMLTAIGFGLLFFVLRLRQKVEPNQ